MGVDLPGSSDRDLVKAEEVIAKRKGDVLIKHTLLKADHFPGCQNNKLRPLLEGAPNFRKVDGLPVYGVAIPTVTGLRTVLHAAGAGKGGRKVVWFNMREEPVIYINGKPYVVREAGQPFCNLEYTGIDRSRVEGMEDRLKQDILEEAKAYDDRVLVSVENDDMQVVQTWEPVTEADVQTPSEVYAELRADGYDVKYHRVPVTDEKAPKDGDFEVLIQELWAIPDDAAIIFNCQMGRGRTTTGMVIACLLQIHRARFRKLKGELGEFPSWAELPEVVTNGAVRADSQGTPQGKVNGELSVSPRSVVAKERGGMYSVIRSLLRVLEHSHQAKALLDSVLDACSAMQNLRDAINSYRTRLLAETKEHKRSVMLAVCLQYLERYYMLIVFCTYLQSPKFCPSASGHTSFPVWRSQRPELVSILQRMLRRNPMAALELQWPAATMPPGTPQPARHPSGLASGLLSYDTNQDQLEKAEDMVRDIVESRCGAVLGQNTILKEDHFPGMYSSKIPQTVEGAPNFRRVNGVPVVGMGMPTVAGIRAVLQKVGGGPDKAGASHALWFNMREEPVVYINGRPFVLREEVRPLKNLQEYAGIDAWRLERMEARLKNDVQVEAKRYGGKILVMREADSHSHQGELVDSWEQVEGPLDVQTPADVYRMLQKEGFRVYYVRVPVTDGTAPTAADFDMIKEHVQRLGFTSPIIFNCQLGAGRTTTGMAIATLLHIRADEETFEIAKSIRPDDLDIALIREELQGNSPRTSEDTGMRNVSRQISWDEGDDQSGQATSTLLVKGLTIPCLQLTPRDMRLSAAWETIQEDELEQKSLAAGGYVGVRRIARLLEDGETAKRTVDSVVDSCSQMLNLRMVIMRYRKPKDSYHSIKSEMQQRHAAYKRGSAYLERYCLLIAFASYLDHIPALTAKNSSPRTPLSEGASQPTFSEWISSRPDLQQALASIHQNPVAALCPVPVTPLPLGCSGTPTSYGEVTLQEQQQVLSKRRGRTLTKRTILKSYFDTTTDMGEGDVDARKAEGLEVYTVGNTSACGLRKLLKRLGAGLGGGVHVLVSDVREELVVYVNGTPYIRRELEMPAAALHHAGIHAEQLEELESVLKLDVINEAHKWGGRVLLHKEIKSQKNGNIQEHRHQDDVTGLVDTNPGAAVLPFWEAVELLDDEPASELQA